MAPTEKAKRKSLKATWDDSSSLSKEEAVGCKNRPCLVFMTIDDEIPSTSSKEEETRLSQGGARCYSPDS